MGADPRAMAARTTTKHSYLSMIRLQEVAKARCEMEIARLRRQSAELEQADRDLLAMQDQRFDGSESLVPARVVAKRLQTNSVARARLDPLIAGKTRELLAASRTLDVMVDRLRSFERQRERAEAAAEIDEFIAHMFSGGSSLP